MVEHLPGLFDLYEALPDHLLSTNVYRIMTAWAGSALRPALAFRYLRERPEVAQRMRLQLLERISKIDHRPLRVSRSSFFGFQLSLILS